MTEPKLSRRQRREQARRIYLESGGRITLTAIAEKVGSSPKSVRIWRREERWDTDLAAGKKATRKAVIKVADAIGDCFKRDIEHLQLIGNQIEKKLKAPKLSASDIKALAAAKSESVKLLRLLAGESTENTAINANIDSGNKSHESPFSKDGDSFSKAVNRIVAGEDPDGTMQALLTQMVEQYQTLVAFGHGDEQT